MRDSLIFLTTFWEPITILNSESSTAKGALKLLEATLEAVITSIIMANLICCMNSNNIRTVASLTEGEFSSMILSTLEEG